MTQESVHSHMDVRTRCHGADWSDANNSLPKKTCLQVSPTPLPTEPLPCDTAPQGVLASRCSPVPLSKASTDEAGVLPSSSPRWCLLYTRQYVEARDHALRGRE